MPYSWKPCHSVQYPLGVYRLPEGYKKQETEEYTLKLCGYIYRHGTYTPLWSVRVLWGCCFSQVFTPCVRWSRAVCRAAHLTATGHGTCADICIPWQTGQDALQADLSAVIRFCFYVSGGKGGVEQFHPCDFSWAHRQGKGLIYSCRDHPGGHSARRAGDRYAVLHYIRLRWCAGHRVLQHLGQEGYTGRKAFMKGLGCILENGMKIRFICRVIVTLFDPIFSGTISRFKMLIYC